VGGAVDGYQISDIGYREAVISDQRSAERKQEKSDVGA